jgi:hypothetical protein
LSIVTTPIPSATSTPTRASTRITVRKTVIVAA